MNKVSTRFTIAMIEPVCAHGGMDYYDYSLLKALQKAGIDAILYTSVAGPLAPKTQIITETFRGVYGEASRLHRAVKWGLALLQTMDDVVQRNIRIVHLHFFDTGFLERIGVWFAKLHGLIVVATIHDVESFHAKRTQFSVKSLLNSLDGIIVHNKISRKEVSLPGNIKQIPIAVIPHGNYISYSSSHLSRLDARRNLGLPLECPVILFFGQIKKVKGLDVAIKAMAMVRQYNPKALLLIAGKMWKDNALAYQELINEYGLMENVVWHEGYVPQERVDWYYYASDTVILPYKRIYQSGVLLMAMSYGIPVVASDLPGMKEVITPDDNGLLFAQGDPKALAEKISYLIEEPQKAHLIGDRGREYVRQHHDWSLIGQMTAEFYNNVLAGK